jgi:PAS domain S-box-containing protein
MRAYLGVPLVTPDGLVVGTLSVMDPQPQHWDAEHVRILGDLAEAILTELQLRIVQRQYEQLLEGATYIIYRTDLGGRFTDVNSVALKLLGYRRDEVIGRSYLEVIRPDYRAVARDAYRRQLIERLPSTYFEFVAQGKDGREVCIGQNVQLMLDQSLPVGFQAIARDITERKQVEAELRSAVERFNLVGQATSDAIWDREIRTNHLTWNDAITLRFGYPRDQIEPTAAWWEERIHPEDVDRVLTGISAVLKGETAIWSAEYRFLRADGTYATVLDRSIVARDAMGVPTRMIGSMQDITAFGTPRNNAHVCVRSKSSSRNAPRPPKACE